MEMRLLMTEGERNVFAQRLADARARHGASFRDIGRSQARNMVRLAAADLYGLFEKDRDDAETMTAGVALHDLADLSAKLSSSPISRTTRLSRCWNAAIIGRCREALACMPGAESRFRSFDEILARCWSILPSEDPITAGFTKRWASSMRARRLSIRISKDPTRAGSGFSR